MAAQSGNGVWKWISGILASVILAGVVTTTGAWLAWGQQATAAVKRSEIQGMVDRGDNAIKQRLDRIDAKLDQLIAGQGNTP